MEPGKASRVKEGEDVELADVRLLSEPGEPSSQAHSWYSANGRGFTVNGRPTETSGGTSHVATVLGESFYARERRLQQAWECFTSWPHPAFNTPSLVLSACVILLLALLLLRAPSSRDVPTMAGEASTSNWSPEGKVFMDFGMTHDYRGRPRSIEVEQGAIAADHGRCSDIGATGMRDGWNAVDAAVAVALCQGVMNPQASGIGGGAFMVIRRPNGSATVIDARELAPAASSETMFSENMNASTTGGLAVAVPLELKGLWLAHQQDGAAEWSSLVRPAAQLARDGFGAHPYLINSITDALESLQQSEQLREVFLMPDGSGYRAPLVNESCCRRPRLAELLDDIAVRGPDALYGLTRSQELADEIQSQGGILTAADLMNAQPIIKEALKSSVFGLEIVGPPPPSSAAAVIAALHLMEGYATPFRFSGLLSSHRLVEALKSAFALRTHLGDPGNCTQSNSSTCFLDLEDVLRDALSPQYAATLRGSLRDSTTQNFRAYGGFWKAESALADDHGTSHISVVDKDRLAVAITTTINRGFGSKVYSQSTGILLNDQMDDFSTPGQSNIYGLAPSRPNFIQPGKKPLSSMSPMILSDQEGRLRLVVGASGGPRIISGVINTILRLVAEGQEPLAAIGLPRLHHQLLPDNVYVEQWSTASASFDVASDVRRALTQRGHSVAETDWGAVCQVVLVDPDTGNLTAASDPRKDGAPSGY